LRPAGGRRRRAYPFARTPDRPRLLVRGPRPRGAGRGPGPGRRAAARDYPRPPAGASTNPEGV